MQTASLELSKELYELSGWDDCYLRWANFRVPRVVNADEWSNNMDGEPDAIASGDSIYIEDHRLDPAYDLGYLLRKFPRQLPDGEYLQLTPQTFNNEWEIGYASYGEIYESSLSGVANTPEDAAAKLAIELFKQGILQKEQS